LAPNLGRLAIRVAFLALCVAGAGFAIYWDSWSAGVCELNPPYVEVDHSVLVVALAGGGHLLSHCFVSGEEFHQYVRLTVELFAAGAIVLIFGLMTLAWPPEE
jgi:hypothetical protein